MYEEVVVCVVDCLEQPLHLSVGPSVDGHEKDNASVRSSSKTIRQPLEAFTWVTPNGAQVGDIRVVKPPPSL